MEHLTWKQIEGAFGVELLLAPIDFPTMKELIDSLEGKKVFLIPPGRIESHDFAEYKFPKGDINFIFGRPGNNLVRHVTKEDDVVSVHTPNAVDMMAISTVGIVLNKYYEQNITGK